MEDTSGESSSDGGGERGETGCNELPPYLHKNKQSKGVFELRTNNGRIWTFSKEVLGAGSQGRVVLGMGESGEEVAIKVMPYHQGELKKQQQTEIRILTSLTHSNIVQCYGMAAIKGQLYVVMEKMSNSLDRVLQIYSYLTDSQIKSFITQILSGLVYLHSTGIIHRDIKPGNILLSSTGVCKIADFGLSRMAEDSVISNCLKGTTFYISPEIFHGLYSDKSDIWAVAMMLLELFLGAVPLPKPRREFSLVSFGYYINNSDIRDNIPFETLPEEVEIVIREALDKNPDNRPTAEVMLKRLYHAEFKSRSGRMRQLNDCDGIESLTNCHPLEPMSLNSISSQPESEITSITNSSSLRTATRPETFPHTLCDSAETTSLHVVQQKTEVIHQDTRRVEVPRTPVEEPVVLGCIHQTVEVFGGKWKWELTFITERQVEQITYHLHKTFKPPKVTRTEPPFLLSRIGWGTFEVGVEIKLKGQRGSVFASHNLDFSRPVSETFVTGS